MRTLLGLLAALPLGILHALGGWIGWLGYWGSAGYRGRLRANAALAGLSAAQRSASIAEAGRMVLETPRLWLRPPTVPIDAPVQWVGAERIERHLDAPGGLVILTPHLGCFEIAAQAYAERFGASKPLTVLYRPARQAWLREVEKTARMRPHLAAAPATLAGVRQMIRALRRGESVGLLPDQVPPDEQGVWAPFFGQPAYTMTLAARLVHQTGSGLVLLWCERLPLGCGYVVRVSDLTEPLPPAGDDVAAATAINSAMESLIRQCPTQYLWGYHRYKAPRGQATDADAGKG